MSWLKKAGKFLLAFCEAVGRAEAQRSAGIFPDTPKADADDYTS